MGELVSQFPIRLCHPQYKPQCEGHSRHGGRNGGHEWVHWGRSVLSGHSFLSANTERFMYLSVTHTWNRSKPDIFSAVPQWNSKGCLWHPFTNYPDCIEFYMQNSVIWIDRGDSLSLIAFFKWSYSYMFIRLITPSGTAGAPDRFSRILRQILNQRR